MIKTKSYQDGNEGYNEISLVPVFYAGRFSLALSLNALKITEIAWKEKNVQNILSYAFSFIEEIKYTDNRSFDFFIDRSSTLRQDTSGLMSITDHKWENIEEKLSLNLDVRTERFSLRLFSPDISFTDYSLLYGADVSVMPLAPLSVGLNMLSYADFENGSYSYYPSLYASLSFYRTDELDIALRAGYISAIADGMDNRTNYAYYVSLPLSYRLNFMNMGMMYKKGEVSYNMFNESYSAEPEDGYTLFLTSTMKSPLFDFTFSSFMGFDENFSLLPEQSFVDASIRAALGNTSLKIGVKKDNLFSYSEFLKSSDFYISLETQSGSLLTEFTLKMLKGRPAIGFMTRLALIDIDNVVENTESRLFDFYINLGITSFKDSVYFNTTPVMRIGGENNYFSLRLPLRYSISDNEFYLYHDKGDSNFDIVKESYDDFSDIFDSISDVFTFIEGFSLSSEDEMTYIRASRDEKTNNVFFDNYSSYNSLSLNARVSFQNMSLSLFVDDLENIRIFNAEIGFYPFSSDGSGVILSAPSSLTIKDEKNYSLTTFAGLTYKQILTEELALSLFLFGELHVDYVDGKAENIRIIYDTEKEKLFGYLAGSEINWHNENIDFSFSLGLHAGRIRPAIYNAFSAMNPAPGHETSVFDDTEGNTFYSQIKLILDFENVDFTLKYSLTDIISLFSSFSSYDEDILSLSLSFTLRNGIGLDFSIARKGFISSLDEIINYSTYFLSSDTIYSVSLIKKWENIELSLALESGGIYEKDDSYANIYKLKEVQPLFSIMTRMGF